MTDATHLSVGIPPAPRAQAVPSVDTGSARRAVNEAGEASRRISLAAPSKWVAPSTAKYLARLAALKRLSAAYVANAEAARHYAVLYNQTLEAEKAQQALEEASQNV
jgi:hypothetical protein